MTHLKEGDKAPDFNVKNESGVEVSLADFEGKKLIIYFYPKDLTPGCTVESCNLRDNYEELQQLGFEIVGVSADTEKRHQKFISTFNLPFQLLADVDKKMIQDYGVWGQKKFMGKTFDGIHRITFIVNERGNIEKIISKVKTKSHTEQILEELQLDCI